MARPAVFAVNLFSLRDGVSVEEFARFSATQDRPVCLETRIVTSFDAYQVHDDEDRAPRILEVMGLTSQAEWAQAVGSLPVLQPIVRRFGELVDTGSVSTLLVSPLGEPEGDPA